MSFYNEEQIVGEAIRLLLKKLSQLDLNWELIVVDDGSTDHSKDIVTTIAVDLPRLRLISYPINRGRGFALRTGITQAKGEIIVTTEIDLSWGEDVVERLYVTMMERPEVEILVASPHLPGGGYKNVPRKRVLFSHYGTWSFAH